MREEGARKQREGGGGERGKEENELSIKVGLC